MDIRPEAAGEADAIGELVRDAFTTAAHADGTEHLVVARLRRRGRLTVSLVAVEGGAAGGDAVVGHVAASPVRILPGEGEPDGDPGPEGWFGLGPLSVREDRRREGIGARLMTSAIDELRSRGAAGCVLLGDPDYYARFRFAHHPELGMEGLPPEAAGYFQALPLAGSVPAGLVRYDPAFFGDD
ncbi:GNAT family N-acetyltransferase [Corynebacterium sp.]|uniref:GNAT family N-acetyltransferase n=1 Tax=Corynebacterium sp. TaxID=1720 RepID=UPI0026E01FAA|nr:N-acetyltransferase [Corynebacterium sp.]MDO5513522.1 N-acetyltransferase [Corynebacterium sp.]